MVIMDDRIDSVGFESLFGAEHLGSLDDSIMDDLDADFLNDGTETPLTTVAAFNDAAAPHTLEPRLDKVNITSKDSAVHIIKVLQAQLRAKEDEIERLKSEKLPRELQSPAPLFVDTAVAPLCPEVPSRPADHMDLMDDACSWYHDLMSGPIFPSDPTIGDDAGSLAGDDSACLPVLTDDEDVEATAALIPVTPMTSAVPFPTSRALPQLVLPTPQQELQQRQHQQHQHQQVGAPSVSPTGTKRTIEAVHPAANHTTAAVSQSTSPAKKVKRSRAIVRHASAAQSEPSTPQSEPELDTDANISDDASCSKSVEDMSDCASVASCSTTSSGSKTKKVARRWTPAQDEELRIAVARHNSQNWKAIAHMVKDRDHVQCLQRWKKVLQPGLVKGMWSKEEDDLLLKLMSSSQPKNWADIAAKVPGRTAKQCRERWSLNLDPSINRGAWTQEEDEQLLRLHKTLGNRWAEIKRHLNGRTENGVKTRFKSIERARTKDKEVVWTAELEAQLNEIAVRFDCRIDEVAKHLPRALRGISSQAMRDHCPLLRESEARAAAQAKSASTALAPMQ